MATGGVTAGGVEDLAFCCVVAGLAPWFIVWAGGGRGRGEGEDGRGKERGDGEGRVRERKRGRESERVSEKGEGGREEGKENVVQGKRDCKGERGTMRTCNIFTMGNVQLNSDNFRQTHLGLNSLANKTLILTGHVHI